MGSYSYISYEHMMRDVSEVRALQTLRIFLGHGVNSQLPRQTKP